jgi:hypothetical protein
VREGRKIINKEEGERKEQIATFVKSRVIHHHQILKSLCELGEERMKVKREEN